MNRGNNLRDLFQCLGPQWSASEVRKLCYTRKLQPGNELNRVEEKAAELP